MLLFATFQDVIFLQLKQILVKSIYPQQNHPNNIYELRATIAKLNTFSIVHILAHHAK